MANRSGRPRRRQRMGRNLGLVEVYPVEVNGLGCGEQVSEHGTMEFGSWDFGDGRGLVEFEAQADPGACVCPSCRLTRAWLASLPAGLREQA